MNTIPTVLEIEAQEIAKSGLIGEAAVAALSKRIFELGREQEAVEATAKALIADCRKPPKV